MTLAKKLFIYYLLRISHAMVPVHVKNRVSFDAFPS